MPSRPARSRSPSKVPRTHWRSTAVARSGGRSANRAEPRRWIVSSCRSVAERSPRASAPVSRDIAATTRLHAVQTEGCAPLARAWDRSEIDAALGGLIATPTRSPLERADDGVGSTPTPLPMASSTTRPTTGSACSRRWYASVGSPVVASEADVVRAHDLARAAGYDVSATGSAGLAGLLAQRDRLDRVRTGGGGDERHSSLTRGQPAIADVQPVRCPRAAAPGEEYLGGHETLSSRPAATERPCSEPVPSAPLASSARSAP